MNNINNILSGTSTETEGALQEFIQNNSEKFEFKELNKENLRSNLWTKLFSYIQDDASSYMHLNCLTAIRLLSRDKTDLDRLVTENRFQLLLLRANLKTDNLKKLESEEIIIEALKCLCNIIFNYATVATTYLNNDCVAAIINHAKLYDNVHLKIIDMKILFLVTALCRDIRSTVRDELQGLTHLIETLDSILLMKCLQPGNTNFNTPIDKLSDSDVDLICEVLKVLFNITISVKNYEKELYNKLISILYNLLMIHVEVYSKRIELHSHVVNLLTNMPNECYTLLFTPAEETLDKSVVYEGQNMTAVEALVAFLETRFTNDSTIKNQDLLTPILSVLFKAVNGSRIIRKYLRLRILPPLRDVHQRPEQGDTLRNNLCRLLTSVTSVKDLVADLLFILCKENVGRMIKYTGYGNAAGLFAQRGLLRGGVPEEGRYSSDSENSDTEEYQKHKHGINPVIGCYEPPHVSATANMTEEQKEYEAMKLVELMETLTRHGIVQPCTIGEDGKPKPIEHVLQLQESLTESNINN
ncbi:hypothetical protein FQA39_LY09636 [Lamprigera yunnana]|nr:hypothetical protein FQA39_LY09636 [Lamprigera yunnana]